MNRDKNETNNKRKRVLTRRQFVRTSSVLVSAAATLGGSGQAIAHSEPVQVSKLKVPAMHDGHRPEVAMLVHPGVTLLDLLGPQTVFSSVMQYSSGLEEYGFA